MMIKLVDIVPQALCMYSDIHIELGGNVSNFQCKTGIYADADIVFHI